MVWMPLVWWSHSLGTEHWGQTCSLMSSSTMFDLGDDVWWPLVIVMYWEIVIHHFIFLAGKLLVWLTCILYTKTLMPSRLLTYFAIVEGVRLACWITLWVGLGGVDPAALVCGAACPVLGPLDHHSFVYITKIWVSLENSKHFIIKLKMLIKVHPDFIMDCGWYLYYFSYINNFINLMFILFLLWNKMYIFVSL